MRLYISKLIRIMQNIDIPHICFAMYYTPHSLKDVCDCKIFCKYNPKSKLGNSNKNYS
jgi:hypothetical protein